MEPKPLALPPQTSETSQHRALLAPFCVGSGLDIGHGGDPITDTAIRFDLPTPYTAVGPRLPSHLTGDCRHLPFRPNTLDFIYSSHLVEDFTYKDLASVLAEWLECLKSGGHLIILAPDQQKFLAHCARTGQGTNDAHKESNFSFDTFYNVLVSLQSFVPTTLVVGYKDLPPYSWAGVWKKL